MLNKGLYEEMVFVGSQVIGLKMFPELQLTVAQVLAEGNVG
jgi:hypothetical protein